MNQRLTGTHIRLSTNKTAVSLAKIKLNRHNATIENWNINYPNRTIDGLIRRGKAISKPTLNYYTSNYNDEEGDLFRLKRAARAIQIFNPFVLKEWNLESLKLLADDLVYFE